MTKQLLLFQTFPHSGGGGGLTNLLIHKNLLVCPRRPHSHLSDSAWVIESSPYLLPKPTSRLSSPPASIVPPRAWLSTDFADFAEKNYYSFACNKIHCTKMVQFRSSASKFRPVEAKRRPRRSVAEILSVVEGSGVEGSAVERADFVEAQRRP